MGSLDFGIPTIKAVVKPNAISTRQDRGQRPGFLFLITILALDYLIWDAALAEIVWFWHGMDSLLLESIIHKKR